MVNDTVQEKSKYEWLLMLLIDCFCVVQEDLWLTRSWLMRVVMLPVWIAFPFLFLLAVIAAKRAQNENTDSK